MDDELNELCEKLKATELEQETVRVDTEQLVGVVYKGTSWILAKLHTPRPFNRKAFKAIMRKIWRPAKPIKFHEEGSDLIMVGFEDSHDKIRIIRKSPWNFDRQLVLFSEFDGGK